MEKIPVLCLRSELPESPCTLYLMLSYQKTMGNRTNLLKWYFFKARRLALISLPNAYLQKSKFEQFLLLENVRQTYPQRVFLYQYLLIQSFLSAVRANEQLFLISVPIHRSLLKVLLRRPPAADHTQAIADFSPEPQCENVRKSIINKYNNKNKKAKS